MLIVPELFAWLVILLGFVRCSDDALTSIMTAPNGLKLVDTSGLNLLIEHLQQAFSFVFLEYELLS